MLSKVKRDYEKVCEICDYVTVEGSGGIVCPIRWDEKEQILLEDVVKELKLNVLIIADAGLGAIHAVVTTAEYMARRRIGVKGIILNHYQGKELQKDNWAMIEKLSGNPVIACVGNGAAELNIDIEQLTGLYE